MALLLCVPFVLEALALAFDRSDLFGLPGGLPWSLVFLAAWLWSPVCVLPTAAAWSAFTEGRIVWHHLTLWVVFYGIAVAGFGFGLAIVLYGLKYWL